ncbi:MULTISPECIES: winged helix-turn-helix transcriptional regulator [Streptomyces]|uniref:Transcriptional regulator n=1 Tax=Streptomyces qinglanensis TaxID=943816 RepID=A0A1E7KDW8_9ACTN|nr:MULTISPECIES: helix-turn-helix domain-containing protein [Streptomyces]MBE9498371.1 helix-turn-helix transcriptional regulator [Streptomyces sp. GKU 257-1]OEV02112.1 transcriptional regulator [Streptomyces qinglanensis]OEV23452.1 transcriptional regulator [Streptomyces nanshensis]
MSELGEVRDQSQECATAAVCTEPESAVTRVFHVLGKRWTGLILAALMSGPGHFAELRRAVPGISERMLSDRLTELATLGLVFRSVEEGPPLRVSYRLTDSGHALKPAMVELTRWADGHLPASAGSCPEAFRR